MAALPTVNERTTFVLLLSFFDENQTPVTPSAAFYRLDDVLTETPIVPKVALSALAPTKEVEITSLQNALLSGQLMEERVVTVEFDYGFGRHGTAEYRFFVKSLFGVTD